MTATASVSQPTDPALNAVVGFTKWASGSLTYSFPITAVMYEIPYGGSNEPLNNFGALTTTQQNAARAALNLYAAVGNVSFSELTLLQSPNATIRLGMSDAPTTAWAYLPSTSNLGGDVWFNKSSGMYNLPALGNYAYATFVHELGHAMGLTHSHENGMPAALDSLEFTVMSYRSYVGASTTTGYTNETWGFPQSLMMYDVAAIQYMYGANWTTNAGNTSYTFSSTNGQMFINGVGQGTPGANRIFMTIWDGGGSDTYDFSNYATDVSVNLQPGQWTTTAAAQLARLHYDGSQIARGNIANALLYNGDTRSLIENAIGGSGNDTIVGNQAANQLYGGLGNDLLAGLDGDDYLDGGYGLDTFDGGAGSDTVSYGFGPVGIVVNLATGEMRDAGSPLLLERLYDIENLIGTNFADVLVGSAVANVLVGGGGDDWLDGGYGLDDFDGGAGSDTVSYGFGPSGIDVDLGAGTMKDRGSATVLETLASIENLIGTAQGDILRGSSVANRIEGGGGNDQIFGMDGDDWLDGGYGLDSFDGGNGIDTVSYGFGPSGIDVDLAAGTMKDLGLAPVLETLTSIENLVGTAQGDILRGSSVANRIEGGGGNDQIFGGGGDDWLDGGYGLDSFDGGTGSDTVSYGFGPSAIYVDLGAGTMKDLGFAQVLEGLVSIENVIGTAQGDVLRGSSVANRLEGGGGNDTLVGLGGADVLMGGVGNDLFVYTALADSLPGTRDTIADFASGDRIDLGAIDANTSVGGDQGFAFIGAAGFSGAGQLRFASGVLQADVNGDGVADFEINITVQALAAGDFVL